MWQFTDRFTISSSHVTSQMGIYLEMGMRQRLRHHPDLRADCLFLDHFGEVLDLSPRQRSPLLAPHSYGGRGNGLRRSC